MAHDDAIHKIKGAIASRRYDDALVLCTTSLEMTDEGHRRADLLRLRAEVFAKTKRPVEAAVDLSGIDDGVADVDDHFLAALYFLRADRYLDALGRVDKGNQSSNDDWYRDEFVFLRCYCAVRLGDRFTAAGLVRDLPDDIEMPIKLLDPPMTKEDLMRLIGPR